MPEPYNMQRIHAWSAQGLLILLVALVLAACDTVPTESGNGQVNTNRILAYAGPSCGSSFSDPVMQSDACTFKVEFWNKLLETQCSNCHDSVSGSSQSPCVLEATDVNVAYTQALTVVDKTDPASSIIRCRVVTRENS